MMSKDSVSNSILLLLMVYFAVMWAFGMEELSPSHLWAH